MSGLPAVWKRENIASFFCLMGSAPAGIRGRVWERMLLERLSVPSALCNLSHLALPT